MCFEIRSASLGRLFSCFKHFTEHSFVFPLRKMRGNIFPQFETFIKTVLFMMSAALTAREIFLSSLKRGSFMTIEIEWIENLYVLDRSKLSEVCFSCPNTALKAMAISTWVRTRCVQKRENHFHSIRSQNGSRNMSTKSKFCRILNWVYLSFELLQVVHSVHVKVEIWVVLLSSYSAFTYVLPLLSFELRRFSQAFI